MTITPSNTNNNVPMTNLNDRPAVDLGFVKAVTKNITPDEVKYVASVKSLCDECDSCGCDECECADVLFVCKIMAFADKFRVLHWAAGNHATHTVLDDFCKALETFKDSVAENIQAICRQFTASEGALMTIELPKNDNALEVINELKICCLNWLDTHKDDREYEGCRNATSTFLETVYKTVYLLRLCK